MELKDLGLTVNQITDVMKQQIYSKIVKSIKKAGGGNNVRIQSDGEQLFVFVARDKEKVKDMELENIVLSSLELKLGRLFAPKKLDGHFAMLKNYLTSAGRSFVLLPDKLNKIVTIYEVVDGAFSKIDLREIIQASFDAQNQTDEEKEN